MFILNLYKDSRADYVYCFIRINGRGGVIARVPAESEYGYYESSASTVVYLNPGDKVDVGNCGSPSEINHRTSFIGFLLQPD